MAVIYSNALNLFNLTAKATPVGADLIPIGDSAVTGVPLKQATITSVVAAGGITSGINLVMGYGNSNNNFYMPLSARSSTSTAVLIANSLYCVPIIITKSTTFTKIGINITSAPGGTYRLGIYDNTGSGGYPGARIVDAGTVSLASNATVTATISQTLSGSYWLVGVSTAAPTVTGVSGSTAANNMIGIQHFLGFTTVTTIGGDPVGLVEASVGSYATALPSSLSADTFSVIANASSPICPLIFLKV